MDVTPDPVDPVETETEKQLRAALVTATEVETQLRTGLSAAQDVEKQLRSDILSATDMNRDLLATLNRNAVRVWELREEAEAAKAELATLQAATVKP